MMNHGSFGQFQRGNSCSQGRGASACGQPQQRSSASCNQISQRSSGTCNQETRRASSGCSQATQRASSSCNQVPTCPPPSCNQSQGRPSQRPTGPSCPCNEMNREQLLNWIYLTKFACVDASLYLDTHPNDMEAIEYFKEHVHLYNEAMKEYAKKYGPLTIAQAHHCDTYWDWVNMPWPWQ